MISVNTGRLGPSHDIDPAAFDDATGRDHGAVAYWTLWTPPGVRRASAVVATRGVSTELIDAVLRDVADWNAPMRANVEAAAASNPATSTDHAEAWLRGEDSVAATNAAANPAFYEIAVELRNRLDPHVTAHICKNRAATPAYLHAHWDDHVRWAASNPNLARHDIQSMLTRYWAGAHSGAVEVYGNAAISDDTRRRGLNSDHERVRLCATANPRCTEGELRAARADTDAIARLARRALARRAYLAAPLDTEIRYIGQLAAHHHVEELIDAATALDDTTLSAAAKLIDAGFDGTMAELLDVAGAVTRS